MGLKIIEIKNKDVWENFLLNLNEKTFLQSWNWGEFQKLMGNKIWRLGIYDKEELISTSLVSLICAKRGKFLLIQHGPNIKEGRLEKTEEILKILLKELKKIAKKEKCSFIRIASLLEKNEKNNKIFRELGFKDSPMHVSAYEATLKLDLTLPEKELLMKFRKTTRYLIRQGIKNPDFEIIKSNKVEDIVLYNKLNQMVAKHQHFVPFSLEFTRNEFEVFKKDNQSLLFFGKYKKEIVASALVIFWSNIGFYHQAALNPKYHKIPISYLLVWEVIKEAKKRGCLFFDFWGYVDPFKNPKHPWAGPTLFKMGFGGKPFEFVKTQDLSLSKKYWLTYFFENLRRIKRGL